MSIIGKVGRKSLKVRLLNMNIHIVLLIGAVTMIYPFLMMMSASFKSRVDSRGMDIVPQYFYNDEVLYKKFIESRYNEQAFDFTSQYKNEFVTVEFLKFPDIPNEAMNTDWNEFITPRHYDYTEFDFAVSEQFSRGVYTVNERAFRDRMYAESGGDLAKLNRIYGFSVPSWEDVREESRDILSRKFTTEMTGMMVPYDKFRRELPLDQKSFMSLDGHFVSNEMLPRYRSNLQALNDSLGTDFVSWDRIILTRTVPQGQLRDHWIHYVKKVLNIHHITLDSAGVNSLREFLKEKYTEVSMLNSSWNAGITEFSEITLKDAFKSGAPILDYIFYIENLAVPETIVLQSVEYDFREFLKNKYKTAEALNDAYSLGYKDFKEVLLPVNSPENNLAMKKDWTDFVKSSDLSNVGVSPLSQFDYIAYLKKITDAEELDLKALNETYGTDYDNELNIYPSKKLPAGTKHEELWRDFVLNHADQRFLSISQAESGRWTAYIKNKYGNIDSLNSAYRLKAEDFDSFSIDYQNIDYFVFKANKKAIFKEQLTRNYIMVLDEIYNNGRAVFNTLWYCLIAILVSLIVNPLAAYAMSRFNLRYNYWIIFFLMLTMAFPPMVMGIPNFLILKNLNLLNTFWALILPAAADGYFIFLLKGFFDSLPKELFESARVDGAGEITIFTRIAMSLSKPIIAVIALGAFNAAYRNFMFAFIVCQDESMWTLMVQIYQLSQRSSPGVGYAALVIAAIPTFAVFIFFQNIIIKGIVVPTEK